MTLPAASYSFLSALDVCPAQTFHRYIAKDVPKPQSKQIEFGNAAHKALEKRLMGRPLPKEFESYEPLVAPIERLGTYDGFKLFAEQSLGVTSEAKPCKFFGDDVFLRGKIDATLIHRDTAALFDWKTGKEREDPFELEIQALLLKAHYPELKKIEGRYIWLASNRVGQRHELSDTENTWRSVCSRLVEAYGYLTRSSWPMTPGPLCGWCPVASCEHNRNKELKP